MNLLAPVSDLMTKELVTISPEDHLSTVKTIFEENSFHHIPVVEAGKLVGMISKSDFLLFSHIPDGDIYSDFLESLRQKNYRVKDLMTTKLAKLEPADRVNVALEVFRVNRFHAVPVVENERVVGIITTFDIIDYLAEDQKAEMKYS